ncbi:MAG: hypothetical protein PHP23_03725 [Desulfobacterales bacterium]|nr:hypothetical protein [Desulfobacterales bacterium]MDD4071887.1 hypothetical protein [Desulfobacterales bacterium]MDD4392496.1 hypothetical protein [Desulfobacterales bacterium]
MKQKICAIFTLWMLLLWGWSAPAFSAAEAEGPDVYRQEITPMTTGECARCHYSVFTDIRDKGGAHQLACAECHEIYHTYKPGKAWKDVVPGCGGCHGNEHGEALTDCLRCHENAHAPVKSLRSDTMGGDCRLCHSEPAEALKKYVSSHSDLSCSECHHGEHGFVPDCTECHDQPHVDYVSNGACAACHPVHMPLVIRYAGEPDDALCAGCHGKEQQNMAGSEKNHRFLKCVFCHSGEHGFIPTCQACHKNGPHSQDMLQKFRGCNNCHGDAHSLKLQGSGALEP